MSRTSHTVPPATHAAIVQGIKDGFRYGEIAAMRGVTKGTVGYHYLLARRNGEITEEEFQRRCLNSPDREQREGKPPEGPMEIFGAGLYAAITPVRRAILTLGVKEGDYQHTLQVARQIEKETGVVPDRGVVYCDLRILFRLGISDAVFLPPNHWYYGMPYSSLVFYPPAAFRMLRHAVEAGKPVEKYLGKKKNAVHNRALVLSYLAKGLDPAELLEVEPALPIRRVLDNLQERGLVSGSGQITKDAAAFFNNVLLPIEWSAQDLTRSAPLAADFEQAQDSGAVKEYNRRALQALAA